MQSFKSIIEAFGCPELAKFLGKPYATVASWRLRNTLPSGFWEAVVAEASNRQIKGVTLDRLAAFEADRVSKNDHTIRRKTRNLRI